MSKSESVQFFPFGLLLSLNCSFSLFTGTRFAPPIFAGSELPLPLALPLDIEFSLFSALFSPTAMDERLEAIFAFTCFCAKLPLFANRLPGYW
jgi:hypothetical protein